MRPARRLLLLGLLLAGGPMLAGCENFDPDMLDVFHLNEKKKLPGERRELFPGGVPGVTQGVPPEYMKGYQETPPQTADALPPASKVNPGDQDASAALKPEAKTAAVVPTEEPKPKPKRKPKPKPAQVTIHPSASQPAAAQSPWPTQSGQAQPAQSGQAQSPWPAQNGQAQSPWPDPKQSAAPSPWPTAPAPGTFSQ